MPKKYRKYLIIGLVIAIVSALMLPQEEQKGQPIRDMAEIMQEGVLRVTTEYGNNSYHIDEQGEPKGFHYQLVSQFAQEHGLKLEVIPEMAIEEQNRLLYEGRCDIIASGRLLNADPDTNFYYTQPVTVDRLVIIQRRQSANDTLCPYLNSILDLAGQTLSIPANSPFKYRIEHLSEEIGDTIHLEEIPKYGSEQLLALVAHGDRCYAICEEKAVQAHIHQYPQLDDQLDVSFNQFYSWIVHTQATALQDSLDNWLKKKGFNLR